MAQNGLEVDKLPQWIYNISLNKAVKTIVGDNFERVDEIKLDNITRTADNSSFLLKVTTQAILKDDVKKEATFILKTANNSHELSKFYEKLGLMAKEEEMYQKILPQFEQLYKDAGKSVRFAPTAYTFDVNIGHDYVLLEDLSLRQYKHGHRSLGLDLKHMEQVLVKLAEFHAASACYVGRTGVYGERFTRSIYTNTNKTWLQRLYSSTSFLNQLKLLGKDQLYAKLSKNEECLVDRLLELQEVNNSEFNVLNHGDCWTNSIFFQHDAFGNIKDTLFIDFQVAKYGSPANDLYYLILSSAASDIKLSHFDYMIRFYYDHLIENLKLLAYHKPMPKLKNLHISLLNHGLVAYLVVSKVLPIVIYEEGSEKNANSTQNSKKVYMNPKYQQEVEKIMPWLDNRGSLDWM